MSYFTAGRGARLGLFLLCAVLGPLAALGQDATDQAPGRRMAQQAVKGAGADWTTTDHTRHKALRAEFKDGGEITEACISCHSEAASQFHETLHWTWIDPTSPEDEVMGKAGVSVNNFCISANGMADKKCSSCHTGWNGKKDGVNCLVCHGGEKFDFKEAFADLEYFSSAEDEDSQAFAKEVMSTIQTAAQNVVRPTRSNCGSCHFNGGGGDGVKHGDLDTSLARPDKALDVHMDAEGRDFQCTRCHTTQRHHIAGRIYRTPATDQRKSLIEDDLTTKITCISCHTEKPHQKGEKINHHTDKVACQSCHIPRYARVKPTKMWWDWSKAGKLKDGKPFKEEGSLGKEIYMSIKGEMEWARNVVPQYFWWNGAFEMTTAKDKIDPDEMVKVAWPIGDRNDPESRIFPFKIHRGNQPYDPVHKTLLTPLLSGEKGFWTTFDWRQSFQLGAETLDLPYSGKYDFVKSGYAFPITHMVAPKEDAVACNECHVREGGRLASLSGIYLPGRDRSGFLEFFGWAVVLGSLFGVAVHGFGRFVFRKNGRKY